MTGDPTTATLLPVRSSPSDTLARIAAELARDPRLKSPNTRRGYLADLAAFEAWRAGRPFTRLLVEAHAAELQNLGRSPTTINRKLAAVRWWARRLADLAQEDPVLAPDARREIVEQSARIAAVGDVRGKRGQKGRHLSAGELMALLSACARDPKTAGVRDAALIALAWATGARRAELAGLQLADYRAIGEDEGDLTIRGKGDKVRVAYVFDGAAAYLVDWLVVRGPAPGPLFEAINKGDRRLTGQGLSGAALAEVLEKRRLEAGLQPLTWHDFRRTFAGNLLDNGSDLVTVQKLMGHSSPTTTAGYDRRGEEVKRRASRSLYVPYMGRRG